MTVISVLAVAVAGGEDRLELLDEAGSGLVALGLLGLERGLRQLLVGADVGEDLVDGGRPGALALLGRGGRLAVGEGLPLGSEAVGLAVVDGHDDAGDLVLESGHVGVLTVGDEVPGRSESRAPGPTERGGGRAGYSLATASFTVAK